MSILFCVQVVEEQVGRRGEAVHPLRPVLHRTLADVQERLTFRAQAFIKVTLKPPPHSPHSLSSWHNGICTTAYKTSKERRASAGQDPVYQPEQSEQPELPEQPEAA